MLRVFTDFNAITPDGVCWLLKYKHVNLADQIKLQLKKGDKIVLYQDEDDDFEVTATLDFKYVDFLKREAWIAIPDWEH